MSKDIQPLIPQFLDLLLDAVCVVDSQGQVVFVNAASERIFGYPPDELIGTALLDLVHPEDLSATLSTAKKVMAGEPVPHFENRYIHKDGHIVNIMWSASWSATQSLRLAVARDVSPLKQAESLQKALYAISEAAQSAGSLASLYRHIHQIIATLLPAEHFCVVLYQGDTQLLTFPYCAGHQEPAKPSRQLTDDEPLAKVLNSGQPLLLPGHNSQASEGQLPGDQGVEMDWLGVPLISAGAITGALVLRQGLGQINYTAQSQKLLQFVSVQIANAISRKQTHTRLVYLANHDTLTNLANRTLFNDRMDYALTLAHREDQQLVLLYLDLDNFKQINDTLGHETGDGVLIEFSQRLTSFARASDTAGRIGGDEFTLLLGNIHCHKDIQLVIEKLATAIAMPMQIGGHLLSVSASIGFALYPLDGLTREELGRVADQRMYQQKNQLLKKNATVSEA